MELKNIPGFPGLQAAKQAVLAEADESCGSAMLGGSVAAQRDIQAHPSREKKALKRLTL